MQESQSSSASEQFSEQLLAEEAAAASATAKKRQKKQLQKAKKLDAKQKQAAQQEQLESATSQLQGASLESNAVHSGSEAGATPDQGLVAATPKTEPQAAAPLPAAQEQAASTSSAAMQLKAQAAAQEGHSVQSIAASSAPSDTAAAAQDAGSDLLQRLLLCPLSKVLHFRFLPCFSTNQSITFIVRVQDLKPDMHIGLPVTNHRLTVSVPFIVVNNLIHMTFFMTNLT